MRSLTSSRSPRPSSRHDDHALIAPRRLAVSVVTVMLAHQRSGSNYLTTLLTAHPNVLLLREPFSLHTPRFRELDLVPWHSQDFDPQVLHPSLADDPATVFYLKDLRVFLRRLSQSGYLAGFKETLLFEKVAWLRAFEPSLALIHLVRDPRAVIASVLRHPEAAEWNYEHAVARYLRDYGPPVPGLDITDALGLAIASWAIRLTELSRAVEDLPAHSVRFEDMVTNPLAATQAILRKSGLALDATQEAAATEFAEVSRGGPYSSYRDADEALGRWRHDLSRADLGRIERSLGGLMATWGYL